jgi:preprotein translocase subunit YajC
MGSAASTAAGSGMMSIVWLVAMVAIFYFMLIRPQKKKEKQTKAMLDAMKPGDSVTTIGGIIGKVLKIKDDKVCIEIGDRTSKHPMTLKREAIASVVPCKKAKKEADVELLDDTEIEEAQETAEETISE